MGKVIDMDLSFKEAVKLSYNELFLWLDDFSVSKGVVLPFHAKDFFISLLHFCELHGSNDGSMYFVEGSYSFFMDAFDIRSIRYVQEAVSLLVKIGLLRLVVRTPKPSLFYFCLRKE